MKTTWKNVIGYGGIYKVSNTGVIVSLWAKEKRELSLCVGGNGYKKVVLCKDKIKSNLSVHRLVIEAFIPNTENKPQVNHKDGDKLNNNLDNLEWSTPSENGIHSYKNGMSVPPNQKPVLQLDLDNNLIQEHTSISDAERLVGKRCHISEVCHGLLLTSCGYKWKFKN